MAIKQNIVIDQGTDFVVEITVVDEENEPWNFTNYTASAMMRKHYYSANSHSFTTNIDNNSILTISMTSSFTSNLEPGRYYYDVEVKDSANVITRVVEGIATVTPGITR